MLLHVVWVVPLFSPVILYLHGYFSRGDVPYTIHEWGNPVIFPVYIYIYPNSLRPFLRSGDIRQKQPKTSPEIRDIVRTVWQVYDDYVVREFLLVGFRDKPKNSQSISFQYGVRTATARMMTQ